MARLPRLVVAGYPAHVTLRGNDRQDVFCCDGDRLRFLSCLREATSCHRISVHAYVLMTNHVHLLATPPEGASLARAVQALGRNYVGYFNGRHGRSGTLWEGRYRSTVIGEDRYLLACHRYIDLNPVRAGLATDPADYPWSSYRHYAFGQADDLLARHSIIEALGPDEESRARAYRGLFHSELDEEALKQIRECSNHGWALGSSAFCESLGAALGRRVRPIGPGWKRGVKRGRQRGLR